VLLVERLRVEDGRVTGGDGGEGDVSAVSGEARREGWGKRKEKNQFRW
jgi:hypothetical protein